MKKLLLSFTLGLALACSPTALAQAKKPAPGAPPAAPAEVKPAKPAAKARPLPFNTKVDEVDVAGKSFTHVNNDGKKVKLVVTDATVFKGEAEGKKFADIKVGDTVNGSRTKTDEAGTTYDVTAITFIGVAPVKPAKK